MTTEQPSTRSPRFALGELYLTPGAIEVLAAIGQSPATFLQRHVTGDWGDLSDGDKRLNDEAIGEGSRILSAYVAKNGSKLWVITEADRASTTILRPDEY
jgi:hypothetical protein